MSTWYLGLSTSGHDPAMALVDAGGEIVFAEATERFLQDKRAWGVTPDHVSHVSSALRQCGFDHMEDQLIVSTSWTLIKGDLPVQVSNTMLPAADGLWLRSLQAAAQTNAGASLLRLGLCTRMPEVMRFDHHLCHAAAAAYQSGFTNATCVVMDGEGEAGALSVFDMSDRKLKRRWRSWGPGSLGTFFAWITGACGFDWRLGEEWKVMGLAAYGRVIPELVASLAKLLVVDRGRLLFSDETSLAEVQATAARYSRSPNDPIMHAADLAASGQAAFALLADQVLGFCASEGAGDGNLILSGGCALNSSYNGTIARRLGFDRVFVPPAPADDGNAIGAAILAWTKDQSRDAIPFGTATAYLGTRASKRSVLKAKQGAGPLIVSDLSRPSAPVIAERLAQGKILGVFRGQAEFGPRALGNRSILADPRGADTKDRINREIKGREAYRPFAPIVQDKCADQWFNDAQPSPYMSFTKRWRPEVIDRVPAVVHEDGTGRLQTVDENSNPWLDELVGALGRITSVPIVLNTSFNIMGKPIVHSVEDAIALLMTSGLDGILLEDTLLEKA
ncbi:carbamoyltransferase C-terminal domain-containing protein [uncultured Roseibium sp.]|uniref:carbamoyltransferase family protein n=1 Tax=uncultured Roseibium sp. TaxID=1936171 RepID=UPI0032167BFC